MKLFPLTLVCITLLSLTLFSSAYGAECTGPWQKIPNYKRSMGAACQYLGLDTHRGTCRPGDTYETFCDDAPDGQYRICPGPRRCDNAMQRHSGRDNCQGWDFAYDRPCPKGYVNNDCQGGCEPAYGR